jgi:tripartite-type tricarboxylate transporter receptor subunit TctC
VLTLTRRSIVLGAMALPFAARAQNWPSGPLKIIVPFPAGGSVDAVARMVQPGLQQRLGATIVIENRPGASGSSGTAVVAKAPADGSSWVFVFDTHAVNPFLLASMPFDTEKELDPVLLIGTAPNLLATHPSRPFKTFADVVAAAKTRPNITYATIGAGSLGHLTMVLLSKRAGVELVHVPYRGGGPAMNDAIAGHVDLIIGSTALVTPHAQGGRVRPIMHTGKTKLASLPDVPSAIDAGFADFESYAWWGVFTAAGTPKAIVDRFGAALADSLRDEQIAKLVRESQQITPVLGGPDELRRFLAEQMKVWGPVVRDNNIKGE